MNEVSKRYNTKVEIPISVIIETIFSDDNHDVETLCRWGKKYGFIDLIKKNENDKLGYYKVQDDYDKQSFYIVLDKEERKQYDYENYLLDEIEKKDKENKRLNNIIDELEKDIIKIYNQSYYANDNQIIKVYNRLKELKGELNEKG